jgi:hypothetical protein
LLKLEISSTIEYLIVFTYSSSELNYGDTIALYKFSFNQNDFNDAIITSSTTIYNYKYRARIVSGFTLNSSIIIFYVGERVTFEGYIIRIYDFDLNEKNVIMLIGHEIDNYDNYDEGEGLFSKSICLNENEKILVLMFYISSNNKSPYSVVGQIIEDFNFKSIITKQISGYDFIPKGFLLNDLIRINDNRFAFITVSYDQTKLYILIFDLYDSYNKMKIRIYQPNLNKYKYVKEMAAVMYNNYLVFSSTVIPSSSSNEEDYFSIFMIFGYVKGIDNLDNTIDISPYFKDIENYSNENNLIMKLAENNN